MKVLLIINDGFEDVEAMAPIDILRRGDINVTVASNKSEATSAHGIVFSNLTKLDNINYQEYDLLVLPGGPQWKQNIKDERYLEIATYFTKNKSIAAICASPTILGKLGLLKGIKYTCFPTMNEDFGGTFTNGSVEVSGNIITSRAAGTSMEFGYEILEYLKGKEASAKIKKSMYY